MRARCCIDSSVPWNFVPQTDAEVFRFAAWHDGSTKADWLLPTPGFLEELTDIPTPPASSLASYAVAPPLVKSATEVHSAAQFLSSINDRVISPEKIIHTRCEDLFRRRSGTVHAQNSRTNFEARLCSKAGRATLARRSVGRRTVAGQLAIPTTRMAFCHSFKPRR